MNKVSWALLLALCGCGSVETVEVERIKYLPGQVIKQYPGRQELALQPMPISPAEAGLPFCESKESVSERCISDRHIGQYIVALRCWGWTLAQTLASLNQWAGYDLPAWYVEKDIGCAAPEEKQ